MFIELIVLASSAVGYFDIRAYPVNYHRSAVRLVPVYLSRDSIVMSQEGRAVW